ncbi:hypothetical protein MMC25_003138 [Agyrium rufum]|nr:hypothetical protein [Agyrium rufum]
MPPRRSSYASVAAGTASTAPGLPSPVRSGTLNPGPPHSNSLTTVPRTFEVPTAPAERPPGSSSDDRAMAAPESWGQSKSPYEFGSASRYPFGGRNSYYARQDPDMFGFLRPSYLRDSRYMEKLEKAHRMKLAAQREQTTATKPSNSSSLSKSSSSVSLPRLAPSHRGMTYEIKESRPPVEEDVIPPLPSKWTDTDQTGALKISLDGLEVKFVGEMKLGDHEAAAARSDHPMPQQCGIYYYEVTVVSKGKDGLLAIGFSIPSAKLERLPGWEPDSWGYHGDDGRVFQGQTLGKVYGPTFTANDVVGCGVNFMTNSTFFTKNGNCLEIAFRDLKDTTKLFPSVGMKKPNAHLKVNFGHEPFMYDIDGLVAQQSKSKIRQDINHADVSLLHPPLKEDALVKELVAQYLAHEGYVETAKAFSTEVHSEQNALKRSPGTTSTEITMGDDNEAVNRQRIRRAILDGDIDKALKLTHAYYPQVLRDNQMINFRLRWRKWIEMFRIYSELHIASLADTSTSQQATNGHHHTDVFGQPMELDEPMSNGNANTEWDKGDMDADGGASLSKLAEKQAETIAYGSALKREYQDDSNREIHETFKNSFAMYAYDDPWQSPTANLLDESGRSTVAEELNSAILVSQGRSSAAALERLYQQTDVLVGMLAEQGGVGALVNVASDFLQSNNSLLASS